MSNTFTPTIAIDSWDEQPIAEVEGTAKVTQASVKKTYTGDIDGTSTTEWLMAYAQDGTATFVGLERIVGTFTAAGGDAVTGSVVLQHVGQFQDGEARATLTVADGSGSGALSSATGSGSFVADPNPTITLELDLG